MICHLAASMNGPFLPRFEYNGGYRDCGTGEFRRAQFQSEELGKSFVLHRTCGKHSGIALGYRCWHR